MMMTYDRCRGDGVRSGVFAGPAVSGSPGRVDPREHDDGGSGSLVYGVKR